MSQRDQASAGGDGLLVGLSGELADAVARAGQSVVKVNARRRMAASGVVWAADGVIVTADHVLELDEGITIGLSDGREVKAQVAGRDPGSDLAVLRAEATGLVPIALAQADSVRVGNLVLAVGRPGETGPMATIGVVSARTGPWRHSRGGLIDGLIQTDVTMYPGFSGGPLVDAAGRMVGLNSSLLVRGVSVAVPGEIVQRVAQALLTQGRVRRGYLGVSTQPVALPAGLAQRLGLTQSSGLMIVGAEAGSPADLAGVMLGDVLVTLAGQSLRDAEDLQAQLGPASVGQAIPLRVIRGGSLADLTVTVGERQ